MRKGGTLKRGRNSRSPNRQLSNRRGNQLVGSKRVSNLGYKISRFLPSPYDLVLKKMGFIRWPALQEKLGPDTDTALKEYLNKCADQRRAQHEYEKMLIDHPELGLTPELLLANQLAVQAMYTLIFYVYGGPPPYGWDKGLYADESDSQG